MAKRSRIATFCSVFFQSLRLQCSFLVILPAEPFGNKRIRARCSAIPHLQAGANRSSLSYPVHSVPAPGVA
ncbi:hypothetical protein DFH09DRAFT_1181901 [Mycena vulgaris]|nr:hypothetical protein DFH09DRAFT_1181901 [Mycena vulgaris]